MCDKGEGVGMGVEKGYPSTGHGHPGSREWMRQFSFRGDVGRQTIVDIVSTKYNNMYFWFEPDICVCKMESRYFGGSFRDYK